ncbi:hypothetical protein Aduo_008532 [Ancylostoma duodenale]
MNGPSFARSRNFDRQHDIVDHRPVPNRNNCFNCGGVGHLARQCPSPRTRTPDQGRRIPKNRVSSPFRGQLRRSVSANIVHLAPDPSHELLQARDQIQALSLSLQEKQAALEQSDARVNALMKRNDELASSTFGRPATSPSRVSHNMPNVRLLLPCVMMLANICPSVAQSSSAWLCSRSLSDVESEALSADLESAWKHLSTEYSSDAATNLEIEEAVLAELVRGRVRRTILEFDCNVMETIDVMLDDGTGAILRSLLGQGTDLVLRNPLSIEEISHYPVAFILFEKPAAGKPGRSKVTSACETLSYMTKGAATKAQRSAEVVILNKLDLLELLSGNTLGVVMLNRNTTTAEENNYLKRLFQVLGKHSIKDGMVGTPVDATILDLPARSSVSFVLLPASAKDMRKHILPCTGKSPPRAAPTQLNRGSSPAQLSRGPSPASLSRGPSPAQLSRGPSQAQLSRGPSPA